MTDAIIRQWHMLRLVPRVPNKISTRALCDKLEAAEFQVDVRTVQRDLLKLSGFFPLTSDEFKPAGWSWTRDAPLVEVPGMTVHTALALRLAEDYLDKVLPETTRSHLDQHFENARAVLDDLTENSLTAWPRKVRVIPPGLTFRSPRIEPEVLEAVHTGLLRERCLKVVYQARDAEPVEHTLHPLGLVYRDTVAYLVCTFRDFTDVRMAVLHRMRSAEVLNTTRNFPEGFDIDNYIESGAFDFLLGDGPIHLEVRFDRGAASRVMETPLSDDQTLETLADGAVVLRATVANTVQLRAWLRSYGEAVEVLGPPDLREEFAATARKLSQRYALGREPV
jgi:predicted DNA-binding transcriptional regulator YafY